MKYSPYFKSFQTRGNENFTSDTRCHGGSKISGKYQKIREVSLELEATEILADFRLFLTIFKADPLTKKVKVPYF